MRLTIEREMKIRQWATSNELGSVLDPVKELLDEIDALREELIKDSDKTFRSQEYSHRMWSDKLEMQRRMKNAEEESENLRNELRDQFTPNHT